MPMSWARLLFRIIRPQQRTKLTLADLSRFCVRKGVGMKCAALTNFAIILKHALASA